MPGLDGNPYTYNTQGFAKDFEHSIARQQHHLAHR